MGIDGLACGVGEGHRYADGYLEDVDGQGPGGSEVSLGEVPLVPGYQDAGGEERDVTVIDNKPRCGGTLGRTRGPDERFAHAIAPRVRGDPTLTFTIHDDKTCKGRDICIPTYHNRAMHDLYRMLMEPIIEPMYDLRLYSSRIGRSLADAVAEMAHVFSGDGHQ